MSTPELAAAHRAKAEAFMEAADYLDRLADLADGPNAGVINLALRPAALTFRSRASRELEAAAKESDS